jgi:hypothetical protein
MPKDHFVEKNAVKQTLEDVSEISGDLYIIKNAC